MKKKKARETIIFVSVFLHWSTNRRIRDCSEISRDFANNIFYLADKNMKEKS